MHANICTHTKKAEVTSQNIYSKGIVHVTQTI